MEAAKGLLWKSNAELLASTQKNGRKSTRTENILIEAIPAMYLRFARWIGKAFVQYSCQGIFMFFQSPLSYEEIDRRMVSMAEGPNSFRSGKPIPLVSLAYPEHVIYFMR